MNQQKLLEWFNHDKYNDNDQQQGWDFIENAEKPGIPHPLVTGKPLEIALERSMIQEQQENCCQFAKNPNLQKFKSTRNKQQSAR